MLGVLNVVILLNTNPNIYGLVSSSVLNVVGKLKLSPWTNSKTYQYAKVFLLKTAD
jgi:hypothetical protein